METVWKELRQYLDKPLSGLPETPTKVSGNLYQVGGAFVFTVGRYGDFSLAGEPIISMVIWAPSQGSVLRAFEMNIEADDGKEGVIPLDMRLADNAITFESIRSAGKFQGFDFMESASYRVLVDGAFIHRQLQSKTYRAYFRSRHNRLKEKPYAIAITR
jgi:hypothetical protein